LTKADREFVNLARELHGLGAVRVKHAGYEVAFGPAAAADPSPAQARQARPLTDTERDRYEDALERLDRVRELGVDA